MKIWLVTRDYVEEEDFAAFFNKEAALEFCEEFGYEILTSPVTVQDAEEWEWE